MVELDVWRRHGIPVVGWDFIATVISHSSSGPVVEGATASVIPVVHRPGALEALHQADQLPRVHHCVPQVFVRVPSTFDVFLAETHYTVVVGLSISVVECNRAGDGVLPHVICTLPLHLELILGLEQLFWWRECKIEGLDMVLVAVLLVPPFPDPTRHLLVVLGLGIVATVLARGGPVPRICLAAVPSWSIWFVYSIIDFGCRVQLVVCVFA